MSATSVAEPRDLWDALGDAKTILMLAAGRHPADDVCSELLSVATAADTQFLSVTVDDTPDERLDVWRTYLGELPAETGVIAVGEPTRSIAASASQGPGTTPVNVDSVSDPADLTGLAIAISAYLDAWNDRDGTPAVCFHTVTSLLYHTDEARVFRFLHSTTGRLRDVGAVAHFHLDPEAFDESTINSFSALFDAVVRVADDGSATVQKRR